MKKKLTINEKLQKRSVKKPNPVLYAILMLVVKIINAKLHTHFTWKRKPGKDEKQIVLIANHASRNDYLFTAPAVYPLRLNYIVGYNEFFRFPIGLLLRLMQVTPKKNFVPDLYCMRQIHNIVKRGGSICFMPEGMNSITGMAQPVMNGGGKLLKHLGLPVYYSKIAGAYMTYTKHCQDERIGRCEVTVDRMFSPEELRKMTPEEIEDRMNRLLAHDDYIYNQTAKIKYKSKNSMVKDLGTLLYRCPKCDSLYSMFEEGDILKCGNCGNGITMDAYYNIAPLGDSVCPGLVTDWTLMEREKAAMEVRKPGFSYSGHVKIGMLPEYKMLKGNKTSEICGEGMLTLDATGLHFDGNVKGEPYTFTVPSKALPTYGMCTDISRFYTFIEGRFVEFYPDNKDTLYWDHLTEELHRYLGGPWQNTEYRHND